MTSINNLNDIVDNGLCIGCGLCQSIAGKENIEISMTPKGRLEPKGIGKISPEVFKKILNVCPGTIVEGFLKKKLQLKLNTTLCGGTTYPFVTHGLLTKKLGLKVLLVVY